MRPAIAIHGGAGVRRGLSRRRQAAYLTGLSHALDTGHRILDEGGSSLDAVTAAVVELEPCS